MALAIETSHLTKRYRAFVAVKDLNLKIPEGQVFSLLGPNGAGKSTTLGMLTTVIKPSSGSAKVMGFATDKESQLVREQIGVLFQTSMLDSELSAYTNLNFQARLHGIRRPERYRRIADSLKLAGLKNRSRLKVEHLSGGMQRRLEVARTLIHHPKVLFLDEPTTGLDPEVRKYIWHELERLRNNYNLTIVLTTHYLDEADTLADTVAIIDKGSVKALGSPTELKKNIGGEIVRANLVEPSKQLATELQRLPDVKDIEQTNGKIIFRIKGGDQRVPQIVSILQNNSKQIKSFQLQAPSLDDVFLAVTGHSIKNENSS